MPEINPFETAARKRFVEEHDNGARITWLGVMSDVVHIQYSNQQKAVNSVRYKFSELQKYLP